MNEMLVSFDLPSNTTIDELDARSVSTRITEHEKANFTVVLTCMADGTKLFPLIIFKLKNVPQGNFSSEVQYITGYSTPPMHSIPLKKFARILKYLGTLHREFQFKA
ncbi:hypothetical protein RclHR1_22320003 [Rhizophagus clarus]|uniref:Uncharacterized protein n=1 Tax=Rhizophagus clarus TaxID=94130 RepID=A0A2Z6QW93_9GLOM|nr:hypothetical protein RclHR1_22320003 [Rhizophagus clarus]